MAPEEGYKRLARKQQVCMKKEMMKKIDPLSTHPSYSRLRRYHITHTADWHGIKKLEEDVKADFACSLWQHL